MIANFDQMIKFQSLCKAAMQCFRGVRWKPSTQKFEKHMLYNVQQLNNQLVAGKYKISKYYQFKIYQPKQRQIKSTSLRDRIVQRSMCNSGFYQQLTKSFIYDNCACLKGRGIDFAIRRTKHHFKQAYNQNKDSYIIKLDVSKFFPSIPHSIAKTAIDKRIQDKRIVKMVYDIIDSFKDSRTEQQIENDEFKDRGIALGSQVSQLTALAVLDDVDHYIKQQLKVRHYVRYMDDMFLTAKNKEQAQYIKNKIQEKLHYLGLKLNPKSCIYPIKQGLKFLKLRFVMINNKLIVRMFHKDIGKQRRKLKAIFKLYKQSKITFADILTHYECWMANLRKSNSFSIYRDMTLYFHKLIKENNYELDYNQTKKSFPSLERRLGQIIKTR